MSYLIKTKGGDPIHEERKRRNKDRNELELFLAKKDARDIPLSIIDFQVMYEDSLEDVHLPLEVGFIWLTFNEGIIHELHKFINPGDPPLGNRSIAMDYSESSHKIPINFEEGETDFAEIWTSLEKFLYRGGTNKSPFLFCLGSKRDLVENCLTYIHSRGASSRPYMFSRLFCLEDLLSTCLLLCSGKISMVPSETEITDILTNLKWDYENSIRCHFHAEVDSSYCSLSIVKRYSFIMFEYLCDKLLFKLTPSHVPDESEANFKISPPASKGKTYQQLIKPTSSKPKKPKSPKFRRPTIPRLMSVFSKHEPVRNQSKSKPVDQPFCEPISPFYEPAIEPVNEPSQENFYEPAIESISESSQENFYEPAIEPFSEPLPENNFNKPVITPRIVISEDESGSDSSEDVLLDDSDCSDSVYMNSRNHPLQVVREPYTSSQVVREPYTSAAAMMRTLNHTLISTSVEQSNRLNSALKGGVPGNCLRNRNHDFSSHVQAPSARPGSVSPPGFNHLSQNVSTYPGFNAWPALPSNILPRSSSDRTSDSQDTICSSEDSEISKRLQRCELYNKRGGRHAHQTYLPRPH